jgi:class 3 adenylate cyclase/predicted ATPase
VIAASTKSDGDWVNENGLTEYRNIFKKHNVGLGQFLELTPDDLKELKIKVGDRKRVLEVIARLRSEAVAPIAPQTESRNPVEPNKPERRQITIMFCDLVDSTTLSGELDPEDLADVMRAFRSRCTETVARWGGYIAKFVGDGMLTYFGWPQAHEDDAERALRAGLELSELIGKIYVRGGATVLATRIGIATGLVVVGELIGEGFAEEKTVVGVIPNLAARLQAIAEPGTVTIAPSTHRLVSGAFEFADRGMHALKGFPEPVHVWRVTRPKAKTSRFAARAGHRLTPLVGRARESGLLLSLWERARLGSSQIALVVGEAGVGKSRLVEVLGQHLEGEPHVSLSWQCSSFNANSALHPFIVQVSQSADIAYDDANEAKLQKIETFLAEKGLDVGEAAPDLATLLSIPFGDRYPLINLSPQRHRQKMIEMVLDLTMRMAREAQLLFVVEDIQWADQTTLVALEQLAERLRQDRILMVITSRPDFEAAWIEQRGGTKLDLRRFAKSSARTMIREITGEKALPAKVLESILAMADGIPLFVEELTRMVLDSGQLREYDNRYELWGTAPGLSIPATLRDSLAARLDQLPIGKDVAQVAATIGRTFSAELLGHVMRRPDYEIRNALAQLCDAGVLDQRGSATSRYYVFKHALIQEAAYRSLLNINRREIHRQVAEALERHFPEEVAAVPELTARHFAEAGLNEPAARYFLEASRKALRVTATSEAIAHLSKGLELIQACASSQTRDLLALRLHASLGTAVMLAKGWGAPEAEQAYEAANRLSHAAEDAAESIWILWGVWVYHLVRGNMEGSIAASDRIRQVADQHDDETSRLVASMVSIQAAFYAGRFQEAYTHCESTERIFRPALHRPLINLYTTDLQLVSLVHRSVLYWITGRADEALVVAAEAEALARSLQHPYSIAWALTWGSTAYLLQGELGLLAARLEEGIAIANDHGFSYVAAMGTMMEGWVDGQRGATANGIAKMRSGIIAFKATGAAIVVPYFHTLLAELLGNSGQSTEALEFLQDAARQVERWGERWQEAEIHRVKGEVLATLPGVEASVVEQSYRRALSIAESQRASGWRLRSYASLVRFLRDRGLYGEADEIERARRALSRERPIWGT